ncbi:MAG: hypothetical protein U0470_13020 [Anaerolineae bacterium]
MASSGPAQPASASSAPRRVRRSAALSANAPAIARAASGAIRRHGCVSDGEIPTANAASACAPTVPARTAPKSTWAGPSRIRAAAGSAIASAAAHGSDGQPQALTGGPPSGGQHERRMRCGRQQGEGVQGGRHGGDRRPARRPADRRRPGRGDRRHRHDARREQGVWPQLPAVPDEDRRSRGKGGGRDAGRRAGDAAPGPPRQRRDGGPERGRREARGPDPVAEGAPSGRQQREVQRRHRSVVG